MCVCVCPCTGQRSHSVPLHLVLCPFFFLFETGSLIGSELDSRTQEWLCPYLSSAGIRNLPAFSLSYIGTRTQTQDFTHSGLPLHPIFPNTVCLSHAPPTPGPSSPIKRLLWGQVVTSPELLVEILSHVPS